MTSTSRDRLPTLTTRRSAPFDFLPERVAFVHDSPLAGEISAFAERIGAAPVQWEAAHEEILDAWGHVPATDLLVLLTPRRACASEIDAVRQMAHFHQRPLLILGQNRLAEEGLKTIREWVEKIRPRQVLVLALVGGVSGSSALTTFEDALIGLFACRCGRPIPKQAVAKGIEGAALKCRECGTRWPE